MSESIYKGPGIYEAYGGRRYEVLGTVGDPEVMGDKTQVVLREEGDRGPILMLESICEFAYGRGSWLGRVRTLREEETHDAA